MLDPVEFGGKGGMVLPRFLRKPARHLSRIASGGFHVTGKGIIYTVLVFGAAAGSAGLVVNGKTDLALAQLAPSLGIAVNAYDITGNHEVSDIEIISLLAPDRGSSILTYDVSKAREALVTNPWIADAEVSKVYPDKLSITINERKPFALWQNQDGLQMINREGKILAEFDGRANQLPLVVGAGADSEAAPMIGLLQRVPEIAVRTTALIRVGNRRWDIELDNGTTILLPEANEAVELLRLAKLDREEGILDRDIERIDMRLADRLVVKLSDSASELIKAKREDQMKAVAASTKERKI